ncbi:hypothetical protein PIB30_039491 [Stylosanthes scabra]|uniref:Uncharacterized protein n=1 Tax=Stylosanthes scabra TaxID=79078 RepID=A0ABU6YDB4_9FABA|nr:hypothetical protein [Stylosanthes scabra]
MRGEHRERGGRATGSKVKRTVSLVETRLSQSEAERSQRRARQPRPSRVAVWANEKWTCDWAEEAAGIFSGPKMDGWAAWVEMGWMCVDELSSATFPCP